MTKKKKEGNSWGMAAMIAAMFVAGVILGAFLTQNGNYAYSSQGARLSSQAQVEMKVPAVDNEGNGVLGRLVTEVEPGTGKVLVNIADVITLGDTQKSAQDAVKAATSYMRISEKSIDVTFNMEVNATAIEGPSAGANMAVAVVFGLMNETTDQNVMMTGTIDEYGRIGRVGAIFEKAAAAKEGGATVFLVPDGQSVESQTVRTKQCRQVGNSQQCKIVYKPASVNIGDELNLTIVEVSTLAEAIEYFKA